MKNIFILFLLSGCSTFKSDLQLSDHSKNIPSWIYSPYEFCLEKDELCATGESKTLAGADAMARNNIASIFEVKVSSLLKVSTHLEQTFPWQGAVKEEVLHSLEESIDQILETVQFKKHFNQNGLTYSLASLDKVKTSEILGHRLLKLDQELNVLWNKKSRTNLRKIIRLYLEREKLNERYSIVSGSSRPCKINYEDIVEWRQTRPAFESLALRIGQSPDWLSDKLKELLTESGFRLVKGDANKAVSVNVDSIKEFLNVQGFEKYTFTLNLTSFKNGEKSMVLSASETVTGRNQTDALLKVKYFFIDYLEQHLSDLHLD